MSVTQAEIFRHFTEANHNGFLEDVTIDLFGVTSQGTLPVATTLNLMKTNAFLV